ncbi:queuosine precursor transporter [Staphylococcus pseudintermedius]|uniref:queuosine precursor transporter n=1 Tax=Staphylococcus pseudintermedius TaxID=283734 RepID=UPI0028886FC5|nr:queuosine precursor transporter [Staphylococcus pseudintermedius]MDT0805839.1 queuosine precursor transporter [Staphylococcus pseudintermedius]MDT0909484.1 queuosine precursor transporter [Staphylococcus pseudintermedius]
MYNEWLGLGSFIVTFVLMVVMFRLFGKSGLYAWVAIGTIIANIQVLKTVDIFTISATLGNVMFASITAYIIGQHIDVLVFNMIKKVFRSDRTFFIRAYGSTTLSSIVDTALFVMIAFYGSLPNGVVLEIFITTYLLKLLTTVLNVPFGYWAKSLYRRNKIKDDTL